MRNLLTSHTWPGNVRELQHCVQTAAALSGSAHDISVDELALACGEVAAPTLPREAASLEGQIATLEKRLIVAALEENKHNHTHAAKQLGISRVGLLNKMRRHGLR